MTGPYTMEDYPGVWFYGNVVIGPGVAIFPGSVIGRPPKGTGSIHQSPTKKTKTTVLGAGSVIGSNAVLYQGVILGDEVLIGDGACIRENTTIDDYAIIGSNATLQNDVFVGRKSRILDLSHITAHVEIGENVFISVGVLTMNDNSMAQGGDLNPPRVEDNARIGGGAALLPGMQVGHGALVATGAVVTHPVGDNIRVQGVPARPYGTTPKTDEQLWTEFYFDQSGG
jgi:acetyltransferase-like isoleucine patch superfamily enzyme